MLERLVAELAPAPVARARATPARAAHPRPTAELESVRADLIARLAGIVARCSKNSAIACAEIGSTRLARTESASSGIALKASTAGAVSYAVRRSSTSGPSASQNAAASPWYGQARRFRR